MASAACKRSYQAARFLSKGMLIPVTRAVQPPDLAIRSVRAKRVKHREHRSRADSSAQKDNRPIAWPQRERSSGRAGFQNVAGMHMIMQKGTAGATRFAFDAHAISIRARRTRQ